MSDLIWAGDKTVLFVEVKDFIDQSDITSYILELPIKSFNNKISIEVMAIRNEIAKNKISIKFQIL